MTFETIVSLFGSITECQSRHVLLMSGNLRERNSLATAARGPLRPIDDAHRQLLLLAPENGDGTVPIREIRDIQK
jgi:hypothetical protein